MRTVRPDDQTVRLLVRSAVVVILLGLAVEVDVEVVEGCVSGVTAWCARMDYFVDTRKVNT